MDIHWDRMKLLVKKRSIGGWLILIVGIFWKRLGDWQNVEWLANHLLPKTWPKIMLHADSVTVILIVGGFAWLTVVLLWPRKASVSSNAIMDGPDLALDWRIREKGIGNWDIVQLRNIGTSSAFNIELKFSWPELSFPLGFEINALHVDKEVEKEAEFVEEPYPHHQNMGRMQGILENGKYADRQPLQVIARFFDKDRNEFEKAFIVELRDWTHEIKVTPGRRKTVQAAF